MEDLMGFIFVYILGEMIFWGVAYMTGCALTPIVSFGKWAPDSLVKNDKTKSTIKQQSGFQLIERAGKTYLGAWSVAFLGCFFWVGVILFAIFL